MTTNEIPLSTWGSAEFADGSLLQDAPWIDFGSTTTPTGVYQRSTRGATLTYSTSTAPATGSDLPMAHWMTKQIRESKLGIGMAVLAVLLTSVLIVAGLVQMLHAPAWTFGIGVAAFAIPVLVFARRGLKLESKGAMAVSAIRLPAGFTTPLTAGLLGQVVAGLHAQLSTEVQGEWNWRFRIGAKGRGEYFFDPDQWGGYLMIRATGLENAWLHRRIKGDFVQRVNALVAGSIAAFPPLAGSPPPDSNAGMNAQAFPGTAIASDARGPPEESDTTRGPAP